MFDPTEQRNLAADAAMKPVLEDLRARLKTWMRQTDDPLLKGPIPVPPNVITNSPDSISVALDAQKHGNTPPSSTQMEGD